MPRIAKARQARTLFGAVALTAAVSSCATVDLRASEAVKTDSPSFFIASDSTASRYDDARYPQSGWGQFIGCALNSVTVVNRAIGARSTKTFIEEGRWNKIRTDMKPGDTVLIQFAHNDAYAERPARFAAHDTTYRQNLVSFVADVRALGGTPILQTPVARRSFESGAAKADYAQYSAVVREVADTFAVPLIDLEASSRALVDELGVEGSKRLFLHYQSGEYKAFPEGKSDDTHFSEIGARRIANLVADGLAQLDAPIAAAVKSDRSALLQAEPLGHRKCQ